MASTSRLALGIALLLTAAACKRGAEDAKPDDICARGAARPEQKGAPPLAKEACIQHFTEMEKANPTAFACARRCIFANDDLEVSAQCTSLCGTDPDVVCPGLRAQSHGETSEELGPKIELCRTRRRALLTQKSPETFQCVASCSAKANDLAEIEECWTRSCKP